MACGRSEPETGAGSDGSVAKGAGDRRGPVSRLATLRLLRSVLPLVLPLLAVLRTARLAFRTQRLRLLLLLRGEHVVDVSVDPCAQHCRVRSRPSPAPRSGHAPPFRPQGRPSPRSLCARRASRRRWPIACRSDLCNSMMRRTSCRWSSDRPKLPEPREPATHAPMLAAHRPARLCRYRRPEPECHTQSGHDRRHLRLLNHLHVLLHRKRRPASAAPRSVSFDRPRAAPP